MAGRTATVAALLERDAELRVLDDAVAEAAGGEGRVLYVEGHAGVGKTRLLREAGQLGEAAGMRVLRSRGSELDRAFGFGLVRQLLERCVSESPDLLTSEPAAAVFRATPAEPRLADSMFAHLQALYWLAGDLVARRPVVMLADDLHWSDTASLRWLAFLAERIEDLALLLVCAARPAEPGADRELLDVLAERSAPVLRPAPLSVAATGVLVRARLPDAVDEFATACHRATGGNAFLLGEMLAESAASGMAGSPGDASQVLDFGSERVGHAVRRRLRLLPAEATAIARGVAVLGPPSPVRDVAELTELAAPAVADAADTLVAVDVLTAGGGLGLDFVHPVVRGAVYDQIPPLECQRLHARAATIMQVHGAETERVGRHVLRLSPAGDAARVAVLRAAAGDAAARGAADAAVRYLHRALREPPAADERATVLHELGLVEAADRRRADFDDHLREAIALTEDPVARSTIALDLGRALASCGEFREPVEIFHEALERLADPDDDLAVALEGEMLAMAFHEFSCTALVAPHWERRFAELRSGAELTPTTLAPLVVAIAASRPPAAGAIGLAEQVLATDPLDAPNSVLIGAIGNGLIYAGALSRAAAIYGETIAAAAQHGNRLMVAWQSTMRSKASLRLGEVRIAEEEARLALELFEVGSGASGVAWCLAHLLDALVVRGALEEAAALVERSDVAALSTPTLPVALLHTSLAHFHLARGEATTALREAQAAGRLASATISNPYCCDWRSAAALSLLSLGRADEARALAEEELADARRFGVAEAEGLSRRTLGLTAGGSEGVQMLRESVARLEPAEGRLEHARSLLELGAALRRVGERTEARDVLRAALDEATRLGASAMADRAHEELIAAGARPRRDRRLLSGRESLTPSEHRVAVLAAEGLSNREIAQRQFVTVKAVQWHLRNIYRKLDVASRDDLPAGLEAGA